MSFDLTHARHDTMTCLAPGLFRSLKRGDRKKLKLDVTYQYGEKEEARFIGFEPLGADDMRLLQGLVALAGPSGIILKPDTESEAGKQLRLFLEPKFDAAEQDAMVVKTSIGKLLSEIGYEHGGKQWQGIIESLRRMANVTVVIKRGTREAAFHLLSYAFDEQDGRLFVALNPRITEAIMGHRPYTRIELSETRQLESDPARLVHQRLCGWIRAGGDGKTTIETLCGYVWPDETKQPNTLKTRRQTVRKSLDELRAVGWGVDEYATGKFAIQRPKAGSKSEDAERAAL